MKGVTTQRLAGLLFRQVNKSAACHVGEAVTQGLDGGTDFSFTVRSIDGSEFLVSVFQTKEATGDPPLASPKRVLSKPQIITIPPRVASPVREQLRIDPKALSAQCQATRDARAVAQRERNRLRFLGDI